MTSSSTHWRTELCLPFVFPQTQNTIVKQIRFISQNTDHISTVGVLWALPYNQLPNELLIHFVTHALFVVAMPTLRFSLTDGPSSQSALSWAGVCAHSRACLVNFYYYDQTAQVADKCWSVAAERQGMENVPLTLSNNSIQVITHCLFF